MSQTVNTTAQQTAPKKLVEVKDLEISFGEGKNASLLLKMQTSSSIKVKLFL